MIISPMKVELIDSMGSDLSIVNAARVSFHKESKWDESELVEVNLGVFKGKEKLAEADQRLVRYLAKHGHFTPFCHAFLSFRIKAPIFVARQLVKHQVGLAWNEVSRRYVSDEPEFWFPDVGYHAKPENSIKQGASEEYAIQRDSGFGVAIEMHVDDMRKLYTKMLEAGVAPEEARMVLPLNSMTEWIWSGSLAAFARVCKLRLAPHGVQKATKEVAQMIHDAIPASFEHSWKALMA